MTRDEAIAAAIKSKEKWGGGSSEAWLVNSLEALGLLKLDEPKGADERLARALGRTFSFETDSKEMGLFRDQLTALGLQIIEKQER